MFSTEELGLSHEHRINDHDRGCRAPGRSGRGDQPQGHRLCSEWSPRSRSSSARGVFSLSDDAAGRRRERLAILTAWGISAIGVFCLVMTFFALSRLSPTSRAASTPTPPRIRRLPRLRQCLGLLGSRLFCARSARRFCSARCRTSSRSSATGIEPLRRHRRLLHHLVLLPFL